jgi:hypothetical protein
LLASSKEEIRMQFDAIVYTINCDFEDLDSSPDSATEEFFDL